MRWKRKKLPRPIFGIFICVTSNNKKIFSILKYYVYLVSVSYVLMYICVVWCVYLLAVILAKNKVKRPKTFTSLPSFFCFFFFALILIRLSPRRFLFLVRRYFLSASFSRWSPFSYSIQFSWKFYCTPMEINGSFNVFLRNEIIKEKERKKNILCEKKWNSFYTQHRTTHLRRKALKIGASMIKQEIKANIKKVLRKISVGTAKEELCNETISS